MGHRVILHSTTIGDGSLVGMGSTLLNRSRIGENCLVGANTLVTEGKEFPDGSMILGAPARVGHSWGAGVGDAEDVRHRATSNHQRFRSKLKQVGSSARQLTASV